MYLRNLSRTGIISRINKKIKIIKASPRGGAFMLVLFMSVIFGFKIILWENMFFMSEPWQNTPTPLLFCGNFGIIII
jgi:hypothetical protein